MREESFKVMPLLRESTRGYDVLCELGAGIFRLFRHYHADVKTKIGIELIQTYIDNRLDKDAIAIQGNVLHFASLLEGQRLLHLIDIFTIVDVLEHLEKSNAIALLKATQKYADRVLAFTPLGFDKQTGHDEYDFKRPGLRKEFTEEQRDAAIESQRHKSAWQGSDFEDLGFQEVIVSSNYHARGRGAIWAVWDK